MSAADEIYQWLIAPIEERMMRVVTRLVRDPDEAADAFQNALAQVWRDLEKIRRHPNPRAYILRVCVSAGYDALRRRSRRRRLEGPLESRVEGAGRFEGVEGAEAEAIAVAGAAANPAAAALAREAREEVLAALAALPPKQAQALLLRVLEDQPFDVVAQALGCSEATARSHVSKARENLRKILKRPARQSGTTDYPNSSISLSPRFNEGGPK